MNPALSTELVHYSSTIGQRGVPSPGTRPSCRRKREVSQRCRMRLILSACTSQLPQDCLVLVQWGQGYTTEPFLPLRSQDKHFWHWMAGCCNCCEGLLTHFSSWSSSLGSGQGSSPLGYKNTTLCGSGVRHMLMGCSLPWNQMCVELNACGHTFKPHMLVDLCNLLARVLWHISIPE